MDDKGNIKDFSELTEEEKKSGRWVEIPKKDLTGVMAMNRKQRRAWYAQVRRANKRVLRGKHGS